MMKKNYPLARLSWFKVGGPADYFARPADFDGLADALSQDIRPVTLLGAGSNLLIRDGGVRGLVVRLGEGFSYIKRCSRGIRVGAATLCSSLSRFALKNSLHGFAFYVGIPGTIGGAMAMNAGCYGRDTASMLLEAKVMDWQGRLFTIGVDDVGYIYRGNSLDGNLIFVEGLFKEVPGKAELIAEQMAAIAKTRETTQPLYQRTCGSVFKNPQGFKAWQLIKEAGCSGLSYNGCKISELHSNFLINTDSQRAENLELLCQRVQERVKAVTGVELNLELRCIGSREAAVG